MRPPCHPRIYSIDNIMTISHSSVIHQIGLPASDIIA